MILWAGGTADGRRDWVLLFLLEAWTCGWLLELTKDGSFGGWLLGIGISDLAFWRGVGKDFGTYCIIWLWRSVEFWATQVGRNTL